MDADNLAKRIVIRPKRSVLELNPNLRKVVIEKLELQWSPEQISGWLKTEFSRQKRMQVSLETIYKSLYVRARNIIHHSLADHLRRKRTMRHPKSLINRSLVSFNKKRKCDLMGNRGRMILDSARIQAVDLINEVALADAAKYKACAELEMSVRTYQRWVADGLIKTNGRPSTIR
jgi:hypothetical protein